MFVCFSSHSSLCFSIFCFPICRLCVPHMHTHNVYTHAGRKTAWCVYVCVLLCDSYSHQRTHRHTITSEFWIQVLSCQLVTHKNRPSVDYFSKYEIRSTHFHLVRIRCVFKPLYSERYLYEYDSFFVSFHSTFHAIKLQCCKTIIPISAVFQMKPYLLFLFHRNFTTLHSLHAVNDVRFVIFSRLSTNALLSLSGRRKKNKRETKAASDTMHVLVICAISTAFANIIYIRRNACSAVFRFILQANDSKPVMLCCGAD